MEFADKYRTADDPAAPAARGLVMRRALIGRLAEAECVTQVSASAGSGKTLLPRPWIAEAVCWAGGREDVEPFVEGNDEG
jgi:hypothetical protein